MNVFEVASVSSIVGGAVAGAVWGGWKYGAVGAVIGLPTGAVLGWVVIFAGPMVLLVGAIAIGVWINDGAPAARRFLWGRGDGPPTDPNSPVG